MHASKAFFTFIDINKSEQKRNLKKLIKLPLDITSLGGVYFNENINTKSSNLKKKSCFYPLRICMYCTIFSIV